MDTPEMSNNPNQTFEGFIEKERARLQKSREDTLAKRAKLDEELAKIDQELLAIDAYEAAKQGKLPTATRSTSSGKRRTGIRDDVLAVVKKNPNGIAFGSRVFVCDNTAFLGDHVIKRRHTANSMRDLPGLVAEVVKPLADQRQEQEQKFLTYQTKMLDAPAADHAILEMYREGILNVQRIPEVVRQWAEPEHEEWKPGTAWHLFNAATFALNGRVAENPSVTRKLHKVIDGTCEVVH